MFKSYITLRDFQENWIEIKSPHLEAAIVLCKVTLWNFGVWRVIYNYAKWISIVINREQLKWCTMRNDLSGMLMSAVKRRDGGMEFMMFTGICVMKLLQFMAQPRARSGPRPPGGPARPPSEQSCAENEMLYCERSCNTQLVYRSPQFCLHRNTDIMWNHVHNKKVPD